MLNAVSVQRCISPVLIVIIIIIINEKINVALVWSDENDDAGLWSASRPFPSNALAVKPC